MATWWRRIVGLAGTLVLLVAAGALPASASVDRVARTPLVGTQWILRGGASGGGISASFDARTMSGEATCNAYNAPYTTRGSRMTIGPDIATTMRACTDAAARAAEQQYLARLAKVTTYRVVGRTLSLRAGRSVVLRYRASVPARALLGRWEATSYYTGSAIQSVSSNATLTATFAADHVSGDGGCNAFSGPYETTGSAITIGPLAATTRLCGDEALDTQEARYLAALGLATSYSVTPTRLQLFRADGGIAVEFQSAR